MKKSVFTFLAIFSFFFSQLALSNEVISWKCHVECLGSFGTGADGSFSNLSQAYQSAIGFCLGTNQEVGSFSCFVSNSIQEESTNYQAFQSRN